MTPEQRQQLMQQRQQQMQQFREQDVRRQLNNAGFTDEALQNAVIEFSNAQSQSGQAIQDKTRQLSEAVRGGSTDAQIAVLLAELRAETEANKARREEGLKALDARIGYSQKPKLEAVLTLMGVTGEDSGGFGGSGGFGAGGFGGGRGGAGVGGQGGQRQGGQRQGGQRNNANAGNRDA